MGNYFKNKKLGFYFSIAITLFALLGGIIYSVGFKGTSEFDVKVLISCIVLVVLSVVLIIFKQERFVPYGQFVLSLFTLCCYIYVIYYYVSVVVVGIDADSFNAQFIFSTIFFGLSFLLSIANVFLKQTKEKEDK